MNKMTTFNSPDVYFEHHLLSNKFRKMVWEEIIRWKRANFENLDAVLDIAAGHCDFINLIQAKHKDAIDWNPSCKTFAGNDVNVIIQDLSKISVKRNNYDLILASNIFEHLEDSTLIHVINNIYHGLKKGGKLICIQPNFKYSYKNYFDDYTHTRIFTDKSLSTILRLNGFTIVEIKPKFLPYSLRGIPHWVTKVLLMPIIWVYLRSPLKLFAGQMYIEAVKI